MRRFIERFRSKRKPEAPGPQAAPPPVAPFGVDHRADATTQLNTAPENALLGSIIVESGPEPMRGKRFAIHNRETRVGRGTGCDIALLDPRVSREHVALVPQGAEWIHGRGPSRRHVAREHGDAGQQQRRRAEREAIHGADAEQERLASLPSTSTGPSREAEQTLLGRVARASGWQRRA